MAQRKIQDKQQAILRAAISVFAERGFWDTPTSLISRTAGVAEGTLFNYFKTKDELINAVYLEIKRELADVLVSRLSEYASTQDKIRFIWDRYIEWGIQHPDKFNVAQQIATSYELDERVRAQANELFIVIEQIAKESIAKGEIREYPVEYLNAFVNSHAVMTIQFISMYREPAVDYKKIGFELLWNSVAR